MLGSQGAGAANLYIQIGQRIRTARQKTGWTQGDLARAIGLSRTSVTNVEQGRQPILVHTLCNIATALSVPVDQLLPDFSPPITQMPLNTKRDERRWIETLVNKPKPKR